jgi:hypothetical protein
MTAIGVKRARDEENEDVFSMLPDNEIGFILEKVARGHRRADLCIKDLIMFSRVSKRLYEIVRGPVAREMAWGKLSLDRTWGMVSPDGPRMMHTQVEYPLSMLGGAVFGGVRTANVRAIPPAIAMILMENAATTMTHISVSQNFYVLDAALALPALRELEIHIGGGSAGHPVHEIVSPSITDLHLFKTHGDIVTSLAGALPGLLRLTVDQSVCPAAIATAAARAFPTITRIAVGGGDLDEITALASALSSCADLRSITLGIAKWLGSEPVDEVPRAICGAMPAQRLTELDLKGVPISIAGVGAISGMLALATLRVWVHREGDTSLAGTEVVEALAALGNQRGARQLERASLKLDNCRADVSGVLATPRFSALTRLSLWTPTQYPIRPAASHAVTLRRLACTGVDFTVLEPFFGERSVVDRLAVKFYHPSNRVPSEARPAHMPFSLHAELRGTSDEGAVSLFAEYFGGRARVMTIMFDYVCTEAEMILIGTAVSGCCPVLEKLSLRSIGGGDDVTEMRATSGALPAMSVHGRGIPIPIPGVH